MKEDNRYFNTTCYKITCIPSLFQLHPDLHQKDDIDQESDKISKEKEMYTAKFKSLNEAYSVLSKPDAKRIYDLSLPGQQKDKTSR